MEIDIENYDELVINNYKMSDEFDEEAIDFVYNRLMDVINYYIANAIELNEFYINEDIKKIFEAKNQVINIFSDYLNYEAGN